MKIDNLYSVPYANFTTTALPVPLRVSHTR